MRLAYCYECKVLTRIADAPPPAEHNPAADHPVAKWRDQHMHGLAEDTHKGGQVFPIDMSTVPDADEERIIGMLSERLRSARLEVVSYVDGIKEDAVKCHQRHGQPSWPHSLCHDYRSDYKRVGYVKRGDRDPHQKHLCDWCPYESSVQVEKKWRAGLYR